MVVRFSARRLLAYLIIVFSIFTIISLHYFQLLSFETFKKPSSIKEPIQIQSLACVVPQLEVNNSWIPQRITPISCKHRMDFIKISPDGQWIETLVATKTCLINEIVMIDDFNIEINQNVSIFLLKGKRKCPYDVFLLSCSRNNHIQRQIHRCFKGEKVEAIKKEKGQSENHFNKDNLNILMFGLDSVSRASWLEQMAETTDFMNEIGAFQFEGYNIVGDGTTAAILGLTTGYKEEELHESRRGFAKAEKIDDFPFIWKQLERERNYVTLWDEDGASIGTFHYRLTGFNEKPVDFYGREFQLALERVGYPPDSCIGTLPTFEEMLHQFQKMFINFPDPIRKFALVFNSHYTHTSSMSGHQEAYKADSLLARELKRYHERNYLNQSVLILFSDHGSRYEGSRATYQGKLAERLPYLAIRLPPWYMEKYPEKVKNLKEATKKLTTPFDLHNFLVEIGGATTKLQGLQKARGISFFKKIPDDRTCSTAGVSPHWCTCLAHGSNKQSLPLDSPLVSKSLGAFEHFVNTNLLADFSNECSKIHAKRPFMASLLIMRDEVKTFVKTIDGHGREPAFDKVHESPDSDEDVEYLQVSFWTEPGAGQWEVTFTHRKSSGVMAVYERQISRTNKYGDAPRCVQDHHPHLRQFCFCKF